MYPQMGHGLVCVPGKQRNEDYCVYHYNISPLNSYLYIHWILDV